MNMIDENDSRKLPFVIFIEIFAVSALFLYSYFFWNNVCSDSWQSCLGKDHFFAPIFFLLLAVFRPFLLTPMAVTAIIGGQSFGILGGTFLISFGATVSALVVYYPSRFLADRTLKPWISANLPETWSLIRTQDYKVIFATRWIPFFPFDLMSICYGVAGFRLKSVLVATFFGIMPEAYVYSVLSQLTISQFSEFSSLGIVTIGSLSILAIITLLPLCAFEFMHRHSGNSLLSRLDKMYREIKNELTINNEINSEFNYVKGGKRPILLLYGFFTSKKGTEKMHKMLTDHGFPVMTFNLGGFFGVLNTKNIKELASFVDDRVLEQKAIYGFEKIDIVAHSKGGLIAIWWLLKLGGAKYCDRLITLGTPFKGTYLAYLAIITPLGFFWKDVWQMRPGSEFLKDIHGVKLPQNLSIFCVYSKRDKVTRLRSAIFEPYIKNENIREIPLNDVSHLEYQESDVVAAEIAKILNSHS